MKYQICWATGIGAVVSVLAAVVILTTAANIHPWTPAVFPLVMTGMYVGVLGAALGAISFCTYQTPYERAQYRTARAVRRAQRLAEREVGS